MLELYATSDCMSCLVNSDSSLECQPEPFRMQDNITFRVTPSAYTEFILSLTPKSGVRLMQQLDVLQRLASIGSPKLYNYFLMDMAFAMLKELSFAEKFKRYATIILPTSQNANNVCASHLLEMYSYVEPGVELELQAYMTNSGFGLPRVVSQLNIDLYKMAVVLYFMSKCKTAVKELNVLYDCSRENF